MKNISALRIILILLLVAFAFTNCQKLDKTAGSFGDVESVMPDYTHVSGADYVTVKVDRNQS